MLLFGGLGVVVSINALWLQSDRHPAPLFRQASLVPQHALAVQKKAAEPPELAPAAAPGASTSATSSPAPQDTEAAIPPSRSTVLARGETAPAPPTKFLPVKHAERDPLADLIGEAAPVPPAPIRPASPKPQALDKAPHAPAPSSDAIAGLIEQSAKGR